MMNSNPIPKITIYLQQEINQQNQLVFDRPFSVGRHPECGLCIQDEVVSRKHAEFFLKSGQWWIRDLGSANGVFLEGQRIDTALLSSSGTIRLGSSGPSIGFHVATPELAKPVEPKPQIQPPTIESSTEKTLSKPSMTEKSTLEDYKEHYFESTSDQDAGEHTMMVRQAFAEIKTKQRRFYGIIIGTVVALLIVTGSIALYKHSQVVKQRKLATEVFYTLRSLEIDLMKLRLETQKSQSVEAIKQYDKVNTQKRKLEKSYESYVDSLGVYSKGMKVEEKIILRMARRFGECEINMPKDFTAEVSDFIEKWQSSERLSKVIKKAKRNGYIPRITKALKDKDLPPQLFYLAVQESNLNRRAVGPPTRFGIAKGMWQFIPSTAEKYGLRTGPLKDQAVVDPLDERHNIDMSTRAAAQYLHDIYTTDAQASGLLVMASYNWGERRVIRLIRTMPDNPQERNFWQLISKYRHKIPDETYDYVFTIFAAAVIGENPRLFGFDFDNPLSDVK